ncbi:MULTISPECIES: hypothetical protein [unclassified Staphylococcus]|uniref:hypothetical protein n=1 Tax=unclassified Staphylococcus TaxID=91994 RepID=UPI0021CF6D23|nr:MULTISPECIES: hypothetical protein [unclassified Staphylococcus]UXR69508.1 hypothetical protein MUA26_10390 [Staphylococcus sp. IVB6246]UXR73842.1 hypothetical protein MUA48_10905 [Staphylococcus sp. IVB6238]UXR76159.1 hypothetical protein MUA74_11000 [Staphylococcus sp. IVB6233]UXR80356.1 hypothetical protein MUA65_10605 [Staphylococcus sp. IVB6218]
MSRNTITLIIGFIFLISGIVFGFKQEWVFASIFILIGILYLLKKFRRDKSNDDSSFK